MTHYLILSLAVVGIVNTLYLSYHTIKRTDVACLFFPKEWCRKVQHSKYSKTLGIPNSFAGLFMYMTILFLTLFYLNGVVPFWWVQIPIAIGFLFSMYFTAIQAFVLRAFCTWCVISAIDFIILVIAAFLY
ncbi:TPA: hypothetical protein DDW69_04875 [candidate division CPR2 bacterium]|uniref:Vitamin K epoxide reductase domain-containing protein n=1 Tax=candidate division CPR2 bacterium GW2011_GWC1_41_48 TaxID=1618344 RepID=A0A0G0W8Q4_UNCC2|nr:MAG: hypothetical protein UT47_C0002G0147 [candidate division CPR2 bacterium GW2011_GWC2_39_35]KKR27883.1 MAG: hypothetical protein UT60_C0033G0006 [candidate division CPR2 bacterium GW2011_GWD2_39_7]KKS09379.1 MAG: hypothetical protein UU65_C0002G0157 [candidate division CPR2 bacterium GW2011_GWC1_41_48]OGB71975.1 MAG: hypothetical protein A2Y26_05080 [candidate division CPR2 bacterium GWD2_39_7]HBG82135.1 hypothetical protein [candidate division CPR2 bacterium]